MVVFYLCISLVLIRNSLLSLIIIGLLKYLLYCPHLLGTRLIL